MDHRYKNISESMKVNNKYSFINATSAHCEATNGHIQLTSK